MDCPICNHPLAMGGHVKVFDSFVYPVGQDAAACEYELVCRRCFWDPVVFMRLPCRARQVAVHELFQTIQAHKRMRRGQTV